jgi:LuxR family maltose regulon positive regulatory protein
MLDDSLERNAALILICGPAGYGKTTIVSDWLQNSKKILPGHFAWLTLERGDDDLARFLSYLVTTLQQLFPRYGEGVLKLLQTHKPPPIPVLATLLINELNETQERFVLVLDDYHLLTTESIQSFIAFLVDHQPPQMRLMIVTRTDPPLPLARLRARGQLVELRQKELCFLPEEVEEYTNHIMNLALTPDQVTFLGKKTEGWISGLQLAAVSMHDRKDRSDFFKAFSDEQEFIADYLTEEVLAHLSETTRSFLLQTSILDRLSASLCEAITGQSESQAILEQLVDSNLFILPLDSQHAWYRYHNLFSDLLRKRLQSSQVENACELHHHASIWYEENDLMEQAIEHAIAGKDSERAARLIEQVAENLLMFGEAQTLLHWLEVLPEEEVIQRPFLGSVYGFALLLCGRSSQQASTVLEKMRNSGKPGESHGEMVMLQALLSIMQADSARAIQLAEQALQQLPTRQSFFRSLAADALGMGYTLAGDIPAAIQAFEQVVAIASQSDNVMMTIMGLTNLSGLCYVKGQLRKAISTCQQVLDLAKQRIGRQTPIIGKTLLNLGEMLREQGDLDTAQQYLQDAVSMMEYFSEMGLPVALLSLARIKMNKQDWPGAQSFIDQAHTQTQNNPAILMTDRLVEVMQARYWLACGQLDQVAEWARRCGFLDKSPAEMIAEAERNLVINELFQGEYLTVIRLTIAQNKPEKALEMIDLLQELIEQKGYQRRIIEVLILKALALHQKKETDQAMLSIGRALDLAEPEGYQRTFIDEGEPMANLLYQAISRKIHPTYSARLLRALSDETRPEKSTNNSQAEALIEPLSNRELEVLELIAKGCSNNETASRLFISLSTVKGHTTNIFGKLGVRNRTQAVARARNLGLLPIN